MTARVVGTFIAIWLGFALVGGLVDGQIMASGDSSDLEQVLQPEVISAPEGGFFSAVTAAFATTVDFLSSWANMLALNFSFFSGGGLPTLIGWIIRAIIGLPVITMFVVQILGR